MDPRLLDYYSRELRYTTAMALEFARNHPKIARRLGMQAEEVGDPYVERLIQAFALVTAHMEMRIDSEYPELMQPLLQTIYPNYVCPTPAMAVACLRPGHESGHAGKGFLLPRGTSFFARTPVGKSTICEFRSSQDVALYPLSIVMAQLTGAPPDIPSLENYVRPGVRVRSALRLRFRTTNNAPISALAEMDKLPIYLTGDERTASHLYELIHSSAVATVMGKPGEFAKRALYAVRQNAVAHEGLEPGQSLLPPVPDHLHGHNLLQEYFACPPRFWFFSLTNLSKGLAGIEGDEVEVVILLSRPAESYAERIDASCFALFCTPIINLFPMRTRRLMLPLGRSKHLIIPDLAAPLDYEVHSIGAAYGQETEDSDEQLFLPAYQSLGHDEIRQGRCFDVQRELSVPTDDGRQYGTRRSFTETQTWLSLVDEKGAPYDGDIRYLSVDALVTNRDLPGMIVPNGVSDVVTHSSVPIAGIGLVRAPSAPKPILAQGMNAWELFGQLSLDHAMFDAPIDGLPPGEGLRRRLMLFLTRDAAAHRQQVESLISATAMPVSGLMPGGRGVVFGRGIECELTFDESGFDGISPYTLGLALEHYLARHVSMHSFARTTLNTKQRGRLMAWPARRGTRNVA